MSNFSPFDLLHMPKELACEFFAVFSRIEFALIESGFAYDQRGHVAPDWIEYSGQLTLEVDANAALADAIEYLLAKPPEVQTAVHQWEATQPRGDTRIAQAISATRQVRHNLFHGGKYSPPAEPGRDEKLVEAALLVLLACLEQDARLRRLYEKGY